MTINNDDREFDWNRKISSYQAILVVLVLSFLVAWFAMNTAAKIVKNVEASQTFNAGFENKKIPSQKSQLPAGNNQVKTNTSPSKK